MGTDAPARLGPYLLLEALGRGATSAVYRARDERSGRTVALKVLAPGASLDLAERFRREAQAARSVDHPNVARVHDLGSDRGALFMALELVEGTTLAERVRARGALPWREAAGVATSVARALGAIHAAGLVHRDVKPANVLLDDAGAVKLTDFGIARSGGGSLTATGELVGTLEYAAPEQADGTGQVDARADLYALGATLHEALTGRPPFSGEGYALVKKHLSEAPPSVREQAPGVPRALEALVLRLLAKAPAARGAGAEAVAEELEALLRAPGEDRRAALGRGRAAVAVATAVLAVVASLVLRSRVSAPPASVPVPDPGRERAAAGDREAVALVARARAHLPEGRFEEAARLAGRAVELAPGLPAAWATRGLARGLQGGPGAAEDLDRALALDRGRAATFVDRARVALERDDGRAAADEATRALAVDPANVDALVVRADARAVSRDLEAGLADAERAVALDPGRGDGVAARGHVRLERDDRGALADLERAVELGTSNPVAWMHRALVLLEEGRLEGAEAAASRAIALGPTRWCPWCVRADVRKRAGDATGALEDLEHGVALATEHPAPARRSRAELRFKLGDYAGCVEDLEVALGDDARSSLAWSLLAEARARLGDVPASLAAASQALELDPRDDRALATRAQARQLLGDDSGALADAEAALALVPGVGAALLTRARARLRLGLLEGAVADADALVGSRRELAFLIVRAEANWRLGRLDAALADADEAQAQQASVRRAGAIRALVFLEQGKADRALEAAEEVVRATGGAAPWALFARARVRASRGQRAEALADLDRAIVLEEGEPTFVLERGTLRAAAGDAAGAAADLETFLRLVPGHRDADGVRLRLAELRARRG